MIVTSNSQKQLANLIKYLFNKSGCRSISEYGRRIGFSHATILDWMGGKGTLSPRGYNAVSAEANCSIDQLKFYLESNLEAEAFLENLNNSPLPLPLVIRSLPGYNSQNLAQIIEHCTKLLMERANSSFDGSYALSFGIAEDSDVLLSTSLNGSVNQKMHFRGDYLVLDNKKPRLASWIRESMKTQQLSLPEFAQRCAPGDREFLALTSYLLDERTDAVHIEALELLAPRLNSVIRWNNKIAIVGDSFFSGGAQAIAAELDRNGLASSVV